MFIQAANPCWKQAFLGTPLQRRSSVYQDATELGKKIYRDPSGKTPGMGKQVFSSSHRLCRVWPLRGQQVATLCPHKGQIRRPIWIKEIHKLVAVIHRVASFPWEIAVVSIISVHISSTLAPHISQCSPHLPCFGWPRWAVLEHPNCVPFWAKANQKLHAPRGVCMMLSDLCTRLEPVWSAK